MKKTVITLTVTALLLSACNTFNGMGQDMKSAGQGISNSAEKVKEKMN